MKFLICAKTDVGIAKDTNQDALAVMELETCRGGMVFAVLCDGMGGLAQGEVASTCVVRAFRQWARHSLPELCREGLEEAVLREQWERILLDRNQRIMAYGQSLGIRMGTTAVVMLLTRERYYVMNVGDSRAYELGDGLRQITSDHSYVAREVACGRIRPEDAEHHPKRNVLLQCVGASGQVRPDLFSGSVAENTVYLLCSDGFRHELSPGEIFDGCSAEALTDETVMETGARRLVDLVKGRGERDNISLVLVKTCPDAGGGTMAGAVVDWLKRLLAFGGKQPREFRVLREVSCLPSDVEIP